MTGRRPIVAQSKEKWWLRDYFSAQRAMVGGTILAARHLKHESKLVFTAFILHRGTALRSHHPPSPLPLLIEASSSPRYESLTLPEPPSTCAMAFSIARTSSGV